MPLFTLAGYQVNYDSNGDPTFLQPATISFYVSDGLVGSLSYTNSFTGEGDIVSDVTGQNIVGATLSNSIASIDEFDAGIFQFTTGGVTRIAINLTVEDPATGGNQDFYFVLSGTPLPELTDVSDFAAFDGTITNVGPVTSGPFAPGVSIPLSSLLDIGTTTAGIIEGTDGDDTLIGTSGNDVFIPGHNSAAEADYLVGSDGYDIYDLVGATGGDEFIFDYSTSAQTSAIHAFIEVADDNLEIESMTGSDTMAGVLDAAGANGMSIYGTSDHDYFEVNSTGGGYINLRGNDGNDTFQINTTERVRLSYNNSGSGIVADLVTGHIADGRGGTDTVNYGAEAHIELRGSTHNDSITGSYRDERFILEAGNDTLDGGAGWDTVRYNRSGVSGLVVDLSTGLATGTWNGTAFTHHLSNVEQINGANDSANRITGGDASEYLAGGSAADTLNGGAGNDTLWGGDGTDTLAGGIGDDSIIGGDTAADLRDVIYGGDGNDTIEGGYGNDDLRGDAGNDQIEGGFGSDTLIGGTGNDTLSGSALGDLIFGGDGADYINGGFGFDRVNGGAGADRFFHLGVIGHGTDWIADYSSAEGDRLVFGVSGATAANFQINWANTPNAGDADVQEAFIIYRPTGQIIWALVDGAANDHIWVQAGANTYDLLA